MERFGLLQEPFQPAPLKSDLTELLRSSAFINPGIVGKLSSFYERENYRVFEANEGRSDAVQRERVSRDHEVLHGGGDPSIRYAQDEMYASYKQLAKSMRICIGIKVARSSRGARKAINIGHFSLYY